MTKTDQLRVVVQTLLNPQNPPTTMRPEVLEMVGILSSVCPHNTILTDDISEGETRTSNGLAVSPTMAAMCANDYMRTLIFIRGLNQAICEMRERIPDRPVRILYAGSGPFATLAIPLMTVFPAAEAVFTILDLHAASVASANAIVDSLGLANSVQSFEQIDASNYSIDQTLPPDIILLEIMQARLEAEPQAAVTRHLLSQAPNAALLPEEIRIDFTLVNTTREFDVNAAAENRAPTSPDRIPLGTAFTLNRQQVEFWNDLNGNQLPGASIRIPDDAGSEFQPMHFTRVQVYRENVVKNYDSGLSSPRIPNFSESPKPGDTVQFSYELDTHPRLVGHVFRP